jgi:poly(ADP-ribose) glycohydrolase ARH3
VTFAVRMGGDTDTIATMAGALSGASAGASAIPRDLQRRLEGSDRIRQLGVALATATL